MPDQTVVMEQAEWQQLLAVLCSAQGPGISWATTNPLVMKIGQQLQAQTPDAMMQTYPRPNGPDVPRPQ